MEYSMVRNRDGVCIGAKASMEALSKRSDGTLVVGSTEAATQYRRYDDGWRDIIAEGGLFGSFDHGANLAVRKLQSAAPPPTNAALTITMR